MKSRRVKYTCGGCGCKILRHKTKWNGGTPYCSSCNRTLAKFNKVSTYDQIIKEEKRSIERSRY